MGFRLIKEGNDDYTFKLQRLKEQALVKETERWTNMTHHKERTDSFLGRFEALRGGANAEETVSRMRHLEAYIASHRADLVAIQGNIDITTISDLLD